MSKKKSRDGGVPFYVLPPRRKSSAEIIREAKNEIKTMGSRRPSTPYSKNNGEQRNNSITSSSASQISFSPEPPAGRPLSGIRLKPLHPGSSTSKESVASLHLEPTVIKTTLSERKTRSKFTQYSDSSAVSSTDVLLASGESDAVISNDAKNRASARPYKRFTLQAENRQEADPKNDVHTERKTENLVLDGAIIGVEYPSGMSDADIEARKLRKFQEEMSRFLPLLEKLVRTGRKRSESHTIDLIKKLYKLFDEFGTFHFMFEDRMNLMKLLFRLLDYNSPILSLHVCKLVLEMKIADRNLANVCKLLYKLCQEEKYLIEFLSCGILGPLFECLKTAHLTDNVDALKYSASLLCLLAANDLLLDVLGIFKCHEILIYYLAEICSLDDLEKTMEFSSVISKVVTALRYLIEEKPIYNSVIASDSVQHSLKALRMYQGDVEVVITLVRLLSKFVSSEDGCVAIVSCDSACETLTEVLKSYRPHSFITIQIIFIIDSLVLYDINLAPTFFACQGFLDNIIVHLELCSESYLEKIKLNSSISQKQQRTEDGRADNSDLFLKVVGTLANMSMNQDVAVQLAHDGRCMINMLRLVDSFRTFEPDSEAILEPLVHILMTINNIAYFIEEDSEVSFLCMKIAEAVIPLLSTAYPMEVRIQACNIAQNITRITEVRTFTLKRNLMPAFVSLVGELDNDIVIGGYAIISNLLLDKQAREQFYKEHGMTKLLHKLHMCLCRDWRTAALLCQILWNYWIAEENSNRPLTCLEINHLIKVLVYATGPNVMLKTDEENDRRIWENEFCIVGKKLLNLLKTSY